MNHTKRSRLRTIAVVTGLASSMMIATGVAQADGVQPGTETPAQPGTESPVTPAPVEPVPETPAVEQPGTETPTQPGTEAPVAPEVPEQPVETPVQTPDPAPVVPVQPAEPVEPVAPQQPVSPEPVAPVVPSEPVDEQSAPPADVPVTPSEPEVTEEPSAPAEPEQPSTDTEAPAPVQPVAPSAPSAPEVPEASDTTPAGGDVISTWTATGYQGDTSVELSNTTVAGQSTLSATAHLGDVELTAPDLHLGVFTDTGVQLGVGDSGLQDVALPEPVNDAVATVSAVSATAQAVGASAVELAPTQVVEAVPTSGAYTTTLGDAGVSVDWDYS